MPKFLNKDIADLTHQLTHSPRRLVGDQLCGIELLLELVEEDRAYPFEFVCFHITGFHKKSGTTSALIPGKALIGDLITMAEVISRKAKLSVAELEEPYLTHKQVADHLNVSTKTIRRWRNYGLLGLRVVFEDGVNRLAFCKSTVERFAVRHQDIVEKGAAFRQLSSAERGSIIGRARELLLERPLKLHAAAKLIAEETGRAVETVRYTLRRHDESSQEPLFVDDGKDIVNERYRAIFRCREAGESLESIASAYDTTIDEVESVLRYVHLVEWKTAGIDYIYNELFDAPDVESVIMDAAEPVAPDAPLAKAPKDTPGYLKALYSTPLLTREQEQDLFRRYNYVKHRTGKLLGSVDVDEVTPEQFAAIESGQQLIEEFKQRITKANLRLVVSIAKKHVGWSPNFFEVISDGNVSLMRAVEKFDYSRGVKFSTYASWAIMKNFARSIPEQHYHSARFVTGQDELLDAAADHRQAPASRSDRDQVRQAIADGMQSLTDREREIVSSHFGLGGDGGSLTLDQLGKRFGVTKERVRQIEKRALARLRDVLAPSLADTIPG
ncbi:MAG: sigma-70 family RNA polymerase sigma factor [Planctomycetota bacterium]|jgi:RNA polymerase sigma factor (sigma-70 family)